LYFNEGVVRPLLNVRQLRLVQWVPAKETRARQLLVNHCIMNIFRCVDACLFQARNLRIGKRRDKNGPE
jgi:hypothetical protein